MYRGMAWIDPNGRLYDFGTTHILAIINYPLKFGVTKQDVIDTHQKFDEKVGVEGKARDVIIRKVIKQGFTRIRYHKQFVSITVNDERAFPWGASVKEWAACLLELTGDQYLPVKLYSMTFLIITSLALPSIPTFSSNL